VRLDRAALEIALGPLLAVTSDAIRKARLPCSSAIRACEVLVSGTVKQLVVGSDIHFAERAAQELRGAGHLAPNAVRV
jgi:hypothetical protein